MQGLTAGLILLLNLVVVVAGPESGPQIGDRVPGPFDPLHLTGPDAGEESCLYCRYGNDPVLMIFARTQSPGLTRLIRATEQAAKKHKAADLGTAVVYLDTSETLKKSAKMLAADEKWTHTLLTCIGPKELEAYKLAPEVDVTVLIYSNRTVRANHTFKAGDLTEKAIEAIMADLPKALPAK